MITADIDEVTGKILFRAPTTSTPLMRQIPGVRHDSKRQVWTAPLAWATCVIARGVLGTELEVQPQLSWWARNDRIERREFAMMLREATELPPGQWADDLDYIETLVASESRVPTDDGLPRHLRAEQRPAAVLLAINGFAGEFDDMGIGKTPVTIMAMRLLAARAFRMMKPEPLPALILVPNGAKFQWRKRFDEWWPEVRVTVAKSGTANVRKAIDEVANGEADVLILNWEALPNVSRLSKYGDFELLGCSNCQPLSQRPPSKCQREPKELNQVAWSTVVADEVHRAKSPKALQTRALWSVGDPANYRFGLTGSPPPDPDEFWTVRRFDSPDEHPGKTAYLDRYAIMTTSMWSEFPKPTRFKPETREELDKFTLPRYIRRPYSIVSQVEPIRETRDVELTGKQLKAYQAFKKGLLAQVDNGVIYTSDPLVKLLRLRQLACAYGEATENGGMVLAEPSSKLDVLDEVLDELGERQAVIFAESRQLIDLLGARLAKREIPIGWVVGGMKDEERDMGIEMFGRGHLRYMLCTVGACAESIDGLQVTDTGIFLQRPWSSFLSTQSEGRIKRSGQKGTPLFIDIITKDSVEQDVLDSLADDADKLEELVHDVETLRRWLS